MRDTKVYLVLKNLSNRERGKFLKFIQSPYFNKNQPLIELFKVLNKDITAKTPKKLEKNTIWKKIQVDQTYDDVRFRKYLSDLLKLLENFLAQQTYEKNAFLKANCLLESVVDKKLETLYSTVKRNANQISENSSIQNSDYFLFLYQSKKALHDIETDNQQKKTISTNFTKLSDYLDIFYFSEKLRLNYDAEVWSRIDGTIDAEIKNIEDITQLIEAQKERFKSPSLSVYYSMFLMNKHPENKQFYFNFKQSIDENLVFFPNHEAIPIYTAGINHCIRKINTGDSSFLEELFILYQGYVNTLVEATNQLTHWTFNNIITVALRLGKFDWVKDFIDRYNLFIPSKHRENAVTYNTATYHFHKKNHAEVIKLLRNIEYEDISYNINSKTYLLRTYYETGEFEPLSFLLESFRAYLNRNKNIPESKKVLTKKLIQFTKKLVNLPPSDSKAITKIKNEISQSKQLPLRNWLLEKIAELE